jgi:hypothetical protein
MSGAGPPGGERRGRRNLALVEFNFYAGEDLTNYVTAAVATRQECLWLFNY